MHYNLILASQRFIDRYQPPGVEGEVDGIEPGDEEQGGELGLEPNCHQQYQSRSNQVLDHLAQVKLKSEQGEKHEDKEDATSQLQRCLGIVSAEGGGPREKR